MFESKISVIIPIYNVEKYLDKCINSVVSQTYTNLEIILVNDGSIDNSRKICDEWASKDKRIIVINQINKGVSVARNKGLEKSSGEYVAFVDADDYLEKNMIKKLYINMIKNNTDLSICSFFYYEIETRKLIQAKTNSSLLNMTKLEFLDNLYYEYYKGYLFNKLFINDIIHTNKIKFDENKKICEDLIFILQYISKCNNNISYTTEPLYYYVIHSKSTMHNMNDDKRYNQLHSIIEAIQIIKQIGISEVYYKYEKDFIFIGMNFLNTSKKIMILNVK